MHDNGARKMVLVGVGPIGCTPNALAKNGVCVKEKNAAALIFSSKLKSLVDQLNIQFKDSKFVFRNSSADTFDSSKGKIAFHLAMLELIFLLIFLKSTQRLTCVSKTYIKEFNIKIFILKTVYLAF